MPSLKVQNAHKRKELKIRALEIKIEAMKSEREKNIDHVITEDKESQSDPESVNQK